MATPAPPVHVIDAPAPDTVLYDPEPAAAADRPMEVEYDLRAPLVLRLLMISILLPAEISFRLSGLYLSPARLLLMVLTPVVIAKLVAAIGAGRYRFVWSDLVVLLAGLWMFLALSQTEGMHDAFIHAGPLALEYCISYYAVRLLLTGHGQALSLISTACVGIGVVALLGLSDTFTGQYFIHNTLSRLGGGAFIPDAGSRLGLLRATSTLDHPILFGFTCSVGLLLAIAVPIRRRAFALVACGIGALIALSSAPIQGVLMGVGLLFYNRVFAGIRFRWIALITFALTAIMLVFTTVQNPFGFVFNHLVFDAESAYYRIYIWQMAGVAVQEHSMYGIGFQFPDYYEIPDTVDSIWLVWSLYFGIPGSVLLGLSIITAVSLPTSGPRVNLTRVESRLGLILGILFFFIIFLGFTVDFFGEEWILIPILVGVRAHLGELGRRRTDAEWEALVEIEEGGEPLSSMHFS